LYHQSYKIGQGQYNPRFPWNKRGIKAALETVCAVSELIS
jgi:hypothetical protein